MADRRVKKTGKDSDGDITSLCNWLLSNNNEDGWGSVTKSEAITHIERNTHKYYVEEAGYRSDVHTYTENGKKHLKTYADATSDNNLDNLPDC